MTPRVSSTRCARTHAYENVWRRTHTSGHQVTNTLRQAEAAQTQPHFCWSLRLFTCERRAKKHPVSIAAPGDLWWWFWGWGYRGGGRRCMGSCVCPRAFASICVRERRAPSKPCCYRWGWGAPWWAAAAERPALIKGLNAEGVRGRMGRGAGYPQERSGAVRPRRKVFLSSRRDPPPWKSTCLSATLTHWEAFYSGYYEGL